MQTSLFIILVNKIIHFNKNFIRRIIFKFLLHLYRVYNAYAMFIQNAILGFSLQYYLNETINRLIVPYRQTNLVLLENYVAPVAASSSDCHPSGL